MSMGNREMVTFSPGRPECYLKTPRGKKGENGCTEKLLFQLALEVSRRIIELGTQMLREADRSLP